MTYTNRIIGAGESGKSTIAKQMKIIYLKGFQAEDRAVFRDIIFLNVITVIKDLIAAARVKELKIGKKAQVCESHPSALLTRKGKIRRDYAVRQSFTHQRNSRQTDQGCMGR